MPSKKSQPTASPQEALPPFRPRTSIRWKVLRQSVLLVSFCVLLLGGLSFFIIRSFQETIPAEEAGVLFQVRWLGITVLILSGLLMLLALFLGTFLARGLTYSLQELSEKVQALKPGVWTFKRTLGTGDELEALDRVVADLTARLRGAYEHLEDKVAERTEQLRRESALDRAILESIEYGVIAVDANGIVTDINPAALKLLQQAKAGCLRRKAVDLLQYVEKKKRRTGDMHPLSMSLKSREPFRSHSSFHPGLIRKDESLLPVALTIAPLLSGKKFDGAIVVFQDMTEERQIDYMKTEFISLASHQLRTPLASIRWYIELLSGDEKKSLTADQVSYFTEIEKASGRMRRHARSAGY
jgi:signal transduction histidine kinase